MTDTERLFRPVGTAELRLIEDAQFEAFPPRLPEQPFFYPVTNEGYASQIARDWNTRYNDDKVGYVTRFEVAAAYLKKFDRKVVGGAQHEELWVPAEELEDFNSHIVGKIEVIRKFTPSEVVELVDNLATDHTKPVLHLHAAKFEDVSHGESFSARLAEVAVPLGLKNVGCMLHEVQPGAKAFPFHNHHNMDEMFVVLEGEGTYRFGDKSYPIKKHDVLAAPAGGRDVAHQIINTGAATLRYLGISNVVDPMVVEYPDSDKFSVSSLMSEPGDPASATLRYIGRRESAVDYFDGEE